MTSRRAGAARRRILAIAPTSASSAYWLFGGKMPPDGTVEAGDGVVLDGMPGPLDVRVEVGGRDDELFAAGGVGAAVQAANVRTSATARRRLCVSVLAHPNALRALVRLALGQERRRIRDLDALE